LEDFHDDIYISTSGLGAFVRRPDGSYSSTTQDQIIHDAVDALQPHVALTFSSNAVSLLLNRLSFGQKQIDVYGGYTIAIIDSIEDIVRPDFSIPGNVSHCICRKEHFVLIWSTSTSLLFQEADMLESFLAVNVSASTDRSSSQPLIHCADQILPQPPRAALHIKSLRASVRARSASDNPLAA